jgi:phosphate transport system substrate-binding protein
MSVHHRGLFLIPFYLMLAVFVFCAGVQDAGAGETIRINGSGAPLELMKPLVQAYGKTKRGVSFEIRKPLGSSGSIKALLAGAIDIAVVSRPLKPEEIARGGMSKPFGRTPLAVVTHRDIRLKTISPRELEDIYAGRTKSWPDGETVRVILRPREDTDTKILKGLSPGMAAAVAAAHQRQGMRIALTDPESNEAVSRTPGGIGTAALAGVLVSGLPLNVVALNGVEPVRKTLADGTYPLAKEIIIATTGNLPDAASQFLEFVYSKRGRALAGKYGVLVTGSGK